MRRYWVEAIAGLKDINLLEQGVKNAWDWAKASEWIRWFTDGERRYSKQRWKLPRVFIPSSTTPIAYPHRKM